MEKLWNTLQFGLKEYCYKNSFKQVILGLSGGLDSALTAVLAADVLGGENVRAVMMKTKYTSALSLEISREVAKLNGLKYQEIDIEPLVAHEAELLLEVLGGAVKGIVIENLQARIRGQILMAISNQEGGLVLACGNKSEILMGYCTLYGDTCGGLAPIGNVYKSVIFELAKWRNSKGYVLPQAVIERAPSAELAEGQIDENSLPPYAVLDAILKQLYDEHKSVNDVVAMGFDQQTVLSVAVHMRLSAFKRKQMAPKIEIA